MEDKDFSVWDLEKHQTKDITDSHINGELTVIWRDWDNIIKDQLKMIYVTSVNPGEIKGPHLHTKRNSYFACIHGEVLFVIQKKSGEYEEIRVNADRPVLISIPKNIPSAHININDDVSRVLTLADLSWKPNDDEMKNVTFDNYDWNKWKK
ncbi:MAG: WxcM-like domain-containing protein [Pelagibacterales bacterium]|nr:WxcM-like domain-containing protein [Pelagibacterales bacterium]